MKNLKNETTLKVKGVNLNRIFKILQQNKISISKINREDYKTIIFNVKTKNIKKVFAILNNPCYTISVEKSLGFSAFISFLKHRIGVLLGVILFLFIALFNNFFVSNVKIYGCENIPSKKIEQCLKQSGIYVGAFVSNVNTEKSKDFLVANLDNVSLVSIIKKGTTIIVNIKEKEYSSFNIDNMEVQTYVSNFSGTIIDMQVEEGTACVKVGDSVKKGDVLIAGYYLSADGKKMPCNAKGMVKAKVWFTHTEIFKTEVFESHRTGKVEKQISYSLMGWEFKTSKPQKMFDSYEEINKTNYVFKNNLFPILKTTNIYYETTQEKVVRNFEDYKSSILKECYEKAKVKIPKDLIVSKSFDIVEQIEKDYVVSAYYEVETYI